MLEVIDTGTSTLSGLSVNEVVIDAEYTAEDGSEDSNEDKELIDRAVQDAKDTVILDMDEMLTGDKSKERTKATLRELLYPRKDVKITGKFRSAKRSQAKKRLHARQGR